MSFKKTARKLYKFYQYRRYRSLFGKNRILKNRFRGERVFILGNGASLNDLDLSLLKNEYTIGCNYIVLHKDFSNLNLSFYADPASKRAIWGTATSEAIRNRGPVPTGTVEKGFSLLDEMTKGRKTQFFFDVSMKRFIEKNKLFLDQAVSYVMSGNGMQNGKEIEWDLTKPLSTMDGSLFFMVNLALYMGFSEIYLCGCGYTYAPQQSGHFYEDWTQVAYGEVDPRHKRLQEIAEQNNATLFNVTPKGFESPVYPPIRTRELEKLLSLRAVI